MSLKATYAVTSARLAFLNWPKDNMQVMIEIVHSFFGIDAFFRHTYFAETIGFDGIED